MIRSVYEAMRFAIEHYGKAGIGADGNYFFPPTEMMSILNTMNMAEMNPEVMIAGILYSTVEDTGATIDMTEEQFGPDVAALARKHLKYLFLGFVEGNRKLIDEIKNADMIHSTKGI